jgi:hypothetical protein
MNGRTIVWVIVVVVLAVLGFYYYQHHVREDQATDGAVHWVTGRMSPEEEARFKKENAGETADGQSEHKTLTARQDDATGFQDGAAAAGQTPAAGQTAVATTGATATGVTGNTAAPNVILPGNTDPNANSGQSAAQPKAASPVTAQVQSAPGSYGMGIAPPPSYAPAPAYPSAAPVGMPMTDSQSANAPNGMRFGGTGNYQWYRQGNLTWRIDTVSGRSCIIYATMEEWHKQIVYSHGCGRNA